MKLPRTYRLEPELLERVSGEIDRRRGELDPSDEKGRDAITATALVVEGLELVLAHAEVEADGRPLPVAVHGDPASSEGIVDPAVWLSNRTGEPYSVCRLRIARGEVHAGGAPVGHGSLTLERVRAGVTVNGAPVH